MANETVKLKLRQPQPADPVSVDNDVSNNMDIVDKYINYNVCTSSTRPNPPVAGMKIFETDTGSLLVYTGAAWKYLNPGGGGSPIFPKGKVAYNTYTSNLTTNIPSAEPASPQLSQTFTSEINRYYWAEMFYNIQHTTGAAAGVRVYCNVRVASGATVTSAGTQLGKTARSSNNWGLNAIITSYRMWEYLAPSTGTKTLGWFWWLDPADWASKDALIYASAAEPSRMLLRDVGA